MAVIKAKREKVVDFFLGMYRRELALPLMYTRLAEDFFTGAEGDTVTMRTSAPEFKATARDYEWRTRTAPIVMDDIIEEGGDGIPVVLDTHLYSATGITDEQDRLDEIEFATEVLGPQVSAVARRANARLQLAIDTLETKRDFAIDISADPLRVVAEMDRRLNLDKVAPLEGRFILAGANVVAAWTTSDRIARYDSTGQEGTPALREAILGTIYGKRILTAPQLDPNHLSYWHPSALVMGSVAPRVPRGASAGRTGITRDGFAARWIQDYDPNYLRDRSVVSMFMGITKIYDERDADGELLPEADRDVSVRALRVDVSGFDDATGLLTADDLPADDLPADDLPAAP
jgi:hypothetical protein